MTIHELIPQTESIFQRAQNTCSYMTVEAFQLPVTCTPNLAKLWFQRQDGTSKIFVTKGIHYSGSHQVLRAFLQNGEFAASSGEAIQAFLTSLLPAYSEAPICAPPSFPTFPPPQPPPPDGTNFFDGVYDPSQIHLPEKPKRRFNRDGFYADITAEVRGQNQALEALTDVIGTHVRKRKPLRPAALLFAGPTGTGKTLTAEQIPKLLTQHTGEEWGYIRIDMNQLSAEHTVARLLGSPPGYIGYDDMPLFAPLMENPRQVILFDEMEKGHPDVLKVLMNVMASGRLEASRPIKGKREFDFRQCVMLFTSNLPLYVEAPDGMCQADITRACREQLTRSHGGQPAMPPEIAARFTDILLFRELGDRDLVKILTLSIVRLGAQYELDVKWIFTDLLQEIVDRLTISNGVRDAEYALESMLGPALAAFADENEVTAVALYGCVGSVQVRPHMNRI